MGEVGMEEKNQLVKLAEFFATERQRLRHLLQSRISELNKMEIEDAISDLMLSMFEKADLLPQIENLTAYVYRALYHRAIDWLRKRKHQTSLDQEVGMVERRTLLDLEPSSPDHDSAVTAEGREFRERLFAALDGIKAEQRAVWVATELEGYTFSELSRMWGIPVGTLLARKHRAMIALRASLQDLYHNK